MQPKFLDPSYAVRLLLLCNLRKQSQWERSCPNSDLMLRAVINIQPKYYEDYRDVGGHGQQDEIDQHVSDRLHAGRWAG